VREDPGSNLTPDGCLSWRLLRYAASDTDCASLQCPGQLSLASLWGRSKSSTSFGCGKGGNVTSAWMARNSVWYGMWIPIVPRPGCLPKTNCYIAFTFLYLLPQQITDLQFQETRFINCTLLATLQLQSRPTWAIFNVTAAIPLDVNNFNIRKKTLSTLLTQSRSGHNRTLFD